MKAQRRHELKESDLSHALAVTRDFLDENGKRLGLVAVLVAAVVIAVAWTVRSRAAAIEDRWRQKSELRFADPQDGRKSVAVLTQLTEGATDRQFVLTSLIEAGQQALRLAEKVDAPPDRDLTEQAAVAFQRLLEQFGDNPLALGVAHLGLATVEENRFALDRDPAHKLVVERHLAALIDDPALDGFPFKRVAMDRRKLLDRTFTPITLANPPPPPETPADRSAEEAPADFAEPADTIGPTENAPAADTDEGDSVSEQAPGAEAGRSDAEAADSETRDAEPAGAPNPESPPR